MLLMYGEVKYKLDVETLNCMQSIRSKLYKSYMRFHETL